MVSRVGRSGHEGDVAEYGTERRLARQTARIVGRWLRCTGRVLIVPPRRIVQIDRMERFGSCCRSNVFIVANTEMIRPVLARILGNVHHRLNQTQKLINSIQKEFQFLNF